MGQMTFAFTKQMLRDFNFVELEELDPPIAEAWPSIPWSLEMDRTLITTRNEEKQTQASKPIYA